VCVCVCVCVSLCTHCCVGFCVLSEAGRARLDPVYAALRYGTSLAQMSRPSFGSMSESPTRSLVRCQRLLWAGPGDYGNLSIGNPTQGRQS
jgi:hypothetical protein